jgi:hypothetical protein
MTRVADNKQQEAPGGFCSAAQSKFRTTTVVVLILDVPVFEGWSIVVSAFGCHSITEHSTFHMRVQVCGGMYEGTSL